MAGVPDIDFKNTSEAFKHKSTAELKEASFLFEMLNHPILGKPGKILLKFAVNFGLPVKPIIKATLYKHFVGGETLEDCLPTVAKLAKSNVKSILDYSEEGLHNEAGFEKAFQELLRNIKFSGEHEAIPFAVFKTTAIASESILEKVSSGKELNETEQAEWKKVCYRFDKLCNAAYFSKVPVMVDAEDSWIQKAIDDLTLEMMEKYNKDKVYVLNTYQLYKKDSLNYLKENLKYAQENNFKIGAKLVRGAYMEKERKRAEEKGYASPIQDTKADTDRDYDEAVRLCINHLDRMMLIVATHNEESSKLAANLIHHTVYRNDQPTLWFSQLLGMCDHITFTLSAHGYNVAKYVPYGPVNAVTPYLIRRAEENSSMEGQAKKEIALIKAELAQRKRNRK
ncbi:MAG: proline dehydrogenase family protein [Bacteroidia bacterium]